MAKSRSLVTRHQQPPESSKWGHTGLLWNPLLRKVWIREYAGKSIMKRKYWVWIKKKNIKTKNNHNTPDSRFDLPPSGTTHLRDPPADPKFLPLNQPNVLWLLNSALGKGHHIPLRFPSAKYARNFDIVGTQSNKHSFLTQPLTDHLFILIWNATYSPTTKYLGFPSSFIKFFSQHLS